MQSRNAPWQVVDRLQVTETVMTPFEAVAPLLFTVRQLLAGQGKHPLAAHGYPNGALPAELPACWQ
jgi:hypothetical protein